MLMNSEFFIFLSIKNSSFSNTQKLKEIKFSNFLYLIQYKKLIKIKLAHCLINNGKNLLQIYITERGNKNSLLHKNIAFYYSYNRKQMHSFTLNIFFNFKKRIHFYF